MSASLAPRRAYAARVARTTEVIRDIIRERPGITIRALYHVLADDPEMPKPLPELGEFVSAFGPAYQPDDELFLREGAR